MAEQENVTLNISDDDKYWASLYFRKLELSEFIVKALILGVIIVVGIIGNCLTFVVFWKGNFKSSTSFLFLSLSLIDSAFLITAFPIYSVPAFVEYTRWLLGFRRVVPFMTVYGTFIFSTTKTATIWVTVLVALNRYIIVCRPLIASQWCTISKVKIQLAVVLVLAVASSIPHLVLKRTKYYYWNNGTSYIIGVDYDRIDKWRSFHNVYYPVLENVLWAGVPFVTNLEFIFTLYKVKTRPNPMKGGVTMFRRAPRA